MSPAVEQAILSLTEDLKYYVATSQFSKARLLVDAIEVIKYSAKDDTK